MAVLTRRKLLALAGQAAAAAPLEALLARIAVGCGAAATACASRTPSPYGRLRPVEDATTGLPLLHLPEGFRYATFGWTGDRMEGDVRTPGAHDGMAAFSAGEGLVRLVRNHELDAGGAFSGAPGYDAVPGGGTTTLEFDPQQGLFISSWPSLVGTVRNCAGGPTPWGSWLSCEETVVEPIPRSPLEKPHGFVFEVPCGDPAEAQPLEAMGRFVHEAVAVDPETGIVYETEDRSMAGLYRFVPDTPGRLSRGGRLEMLAVEGRSRYDTRTRQRRGLPLPVSWVAIRDPLRAHAVAARRDGIGVFSQGFAGGGAVFSRLEGAFFDRGRLLFVSTDGGDTGPGQIWELDPASQRLRLLFESPNSEVLAFPDNLCASPRGGILLCEDGEGETTPQLRGLTEDGLVFPFARNAVRLRGERNGISGDFSRSELAGACWSPDGRWLFFNVQRPGITFAVTGPWGRGGL